jgi:3-hydroxyacyl-CoA dehydrogenase/enoyl-CoA hydratase/3-hydroxybutyryl-CoA epimerase
MIDYSKDSDNIATLTINVENSPMNVINAAFVPELIQSLESVFADADARGLIFTSARKEFIVGADLGLVLMLKDKDDSLAMTAKLHGIFRRMEKWGKPIVAAMNGTALGGGFELCLACNYRIALNNPGTLVGLPEAKLGLLPGWGGTQRLPRMVGFEKALPLILQGTTLKVPEALAQGLVDEVVSSREELISRSREWILANPTVTKPWDEKSFKLPGGEVQAPRGYQFFPVTVAMLKEKTQGNFPAPFAILRAVYEGLQVPFDKGLEIEQKYFAELAVGAVAKGMIRTLFFAMNDCKKGLARPQLPKRDITKVGILGAGMMGAGIAYVSAVAGIQVVLKDVTMAAAEKGKGYSVKILDKMITQGRMTEEKKNEILARITTTDDPDKMEGCELVIEAVIENRAIKAQVTAESEKVMAPDAVFASNTSTLPITGLATQSVRPENFIGMHFFSPVDKMSIIEIIMGQKTGEAALALAMDYTKKIGFTPIVVNDGRGFYTSRVFISYVSEGIMCLAEGIAPALIENAGKAVGMPVGPLAVADEVGIDLIHHIMTQTIEDLGVEKAGNQTTFSVSDLFVNQLGRLGKKAGKGFYDYPPQGLKCLSDELGRQFPLKAEQPDVELLKRRLITIQVLETIRCFEEGIVTTVRDADVGSILAWGFPPYTGGALSYVDFRGVANFMNDCRELEKLYGKRFAAPAILKTMARENRGFNS